MPGETSDATGEFIQMRTCAILAIAAALGLGGASSSFAADIPAKAPVHKAPAAVVGATWTGLYAGGHVGGAWSRSQWRTQATSLDFDPVTHDAASVIGGAQVGLRYQLANNWVIGVEAMYGWTKLRRYEVSAFLAAAGLPNRARGTDIRAIYSATGSLGYAWDMTLAYVKGGWAGAKVDFDADNLNPGGATLGTSTTLSGWTAGAGVERRVWSNFSVGLEYNFYRLSRGDITQLTSSNGVVVPCAFCNIRTDVHTVAVRGNVTFGPR